MENKYIERPSKMSDEERKRKHIEASNKYNKENYKQLKANIKPDDYNIIDARCKDKKISKAQFIVAACKYCIDNNIDPSKGQKTE